MKIPLDIYFKSVPMKKELVPAYFEAMTKELMFLMEKVKGFYRVNHIRFDDKSFFKEHSQEALSHVVQGFLEEKNEKEGVSCEYLSLGIKAKSQIGAVLITQTSSLKDYISSPIASKTIRRLSEDELFSRYLKYIWNNKKALDSYHLKQRFGGEYAKKMTDFLSNHPDYFEKRGYLYILKKSPPTLTF